MATIKPNAAERLAKDPNLQTRAFLVFGTDPGSIHECATGIVKAVTGSLNDPFNVVQLDEAILKDDPGRLADEAQAISMFGGRRAVWLRDTANASQTALLTYLENPLGDAVVVVEAGNLAKTSPVRKFFEGSRNTAAVPCYPDTARDLHELVSELLERQNLKIDMEARTLLVSLLGDDRSLSIAEVEKLALYCFGNESISAEDVLEICGDASAQSAEAMIDAIFEGNAGDACSNYSALMEQTGNPSPILSSLARHVAVLEQLRVEVDGGRSADSVVKSARPPLFFKRQPSIARQLNTWSLPALRRARKSVFQATQLTRQYPALQSELGERCLLSLARSAKVSRSA